MKIEAGKYYKTRDGRKVGPMRELNRRLTEYPWTYVSGDMPDKRYHDNGYLLGSSIDSDLISEWQDQPSPIRTITRREIVAGVYGRVVIGDNGSILLRQRVYTPEELREAAHILNQIAEVLGENGK